MESQSIASNVTITFHLMTSIHDLTTEATGTVIPKFESTLELRPEQIRASISQWSAQLIKPESRFA